MKTLVILSALLSVSQAEAAGPCSLGLAKKFADGIIAVEVKENKYRPGRLVFRRSSSYEYTVKGFQENLDRYGGSLSQKEMEIKQRLENDPNLHAYRLKYTWEAEDNLDLGFYYIAILNDYGRGCSLDSLKQQ